jgi:hypothetical protein
MTSANQSSNLHQSKRQNRKGLGLFPRFECALCRMELRWHSLMKALPSPLHGLLYRLPRAYGFVKEMHSLLHRMAVVCRRPYGMYGIYMGPLEEEPRGSQKLNIRTHACMKDTRTLILDRPWATFVDVELIRDAWLAGAKWGENSPCRSKQESSSTPPKCDVSSIIEL